MIFIDYTAQPTVSKHWGTKQQTATQNNTVNANY